MEESFDGTFSKFFERLSPFIRITLREKQAESHSQLGSFGGGIVLQAKSLGEAVQGFIAPIGALFCCNNESIATAMADRIATDQSVGAHKKAKTC